MKYAILGPQKGINRISDTEPQSVPEQATVAEITDEQAATVQAGREVTPRVQYFLIDGELKTMQEKQAITQAARLAERVANMTPEEKINEGKRFVQNAGYGADEKVICLNKLLKVKDQNALASYPKLVACYAWLETVQAMAVAGQVNFPPAPHTFEEVVSE
jgi:hypothetical protein